MTIKYRTLVCKKHCCESASFSGSESLSFFMPIQIRILPRIIHMLEKLKICLTYIHNSASLNSFTILVSVKGVLMFNILDSVLKFSGKGIV
jgi:hypothetical protein